MPVSLVIPLPSTAAMMVGALRNWSAVERARALTGLKLASCLPARTMLGTLPFLLFGRSTDLDESQRMEHD